jgi:hypothetical protein
MLNPRPNPRRAPIEDDRARLPSTPIGEGLADNFRATRETHHLGARDRLLERDYEGQIEAIEKATGERLFHPLQDRVDSVEAANLERYRRLQQTGQGFTVAIAEVRKRANVAAFEKELERLRGQYPDNDIFYGNEERQARVNAYQQSVRHKAGQAHPVVRFVGGIAGDFTDPVTLVTLPIGLSSKTILGAAIREAGINAGVEATLQPALQQQEADFGNKAGGLQAAANIVTAGVGGAVLGGGVKAIQKGVGFVGREAMIRFGKASDDPTLRSAALDLERQADIEGLATEINPEAGPAEKGQVAEIVSTIERAMEGQREAIDQLARLQTVVDADGNPLIRPERKSPETPADRPDAGQIDPPSESPSFPAEPPPRRAEAPGSLERALDPEQRLRVGEEPKLDADGKPQPAPEPQRKPVPEVDPARAFDEADPRAPEYEAQTRQLAAELDALPDDMVFRLEDSLDANGNPVARDVTKAQLAKEIAHGRRALERLRECVV